VLGVSADRRGERRTAWLKGASLLAVLAGVAVVGVTLRTYADREPGAPPRLVIEVDGRPIVGEAAVVLQTGELAGLTGRVLDGEGEILDRHVRWAVSDESIAALGPGDTLVGVATGRGVLIAAVDEIRRTLPVEVRPPERSPSGPVASTPVASTAVDSAASAATASPGPTGAGVVSLTSASRATPGVLVVSVPNAWAYISLDGDTASSGGTSAGRVERFEVAPGRPHRLRVENPGMAPWDTTVVIEAGDTVVLSRQLQGSR
jgi:hypothetical protein